MTLPHRRERYRSRLLGMALFALALAAIPAAAILGQRLRESQEVAVAVAPAPSAVETASDDRDAAIGLMIEKLDRENARQTHPADISPRKLAVNARSGVTTIR
jgi:hypothetical protein